MYLILHSIYHQMHRLAKTGCLAAVLVFACIQGHNQPNTTIELTKPKQYSNRNLPAEKTGNKKFTTPKRIYNNAVSRFNYYFNANNRLNEIIERARAVYKDDYTQLLSFYNYSLDVTAKDIIDTVIYKCTAGILLHDLRSNWVDKFYVLMGKAYLFRKDFDSATHVFQYINYAFAPKDEGYDIPLGSNASNTNGIFTIATDENRSFWQKTTTSLPGRNESFIWQVRTYIEQGKQAEAAGLLELLRSDPKFPARLQTSLHEMTAYWFYRQQVYDSAAWHLTNALPGAGNKQAAARWEYLAAQLYKLAGKDKEAVQLFGQSIQHTTDPLMEVHARLNIAGIATGKKENALQENLDELLKMARRDKYETYRDIIYYAAAKLEIAGKNNAAAKKWLLNSIAYSNDNLSQKQQSFLLLADINYNSKAYAAAYRFYDSINVSMITEEDRKKIEARKPALQVIAENDNILHREDSLQKLSLLPAEERNAFVRKILKRLRKEKGLKDADAEAPSFGASQTSTGTDLFGGNNNDFYFLNSSLKVKGAGEFKSHWGNRPNIDNWRRQSAVDRAFNSSGSGQQLTQQQVKPDNKTQADKELTMDALLGNIPLTTKQKEASGNAVIKALLGNATIFKTQLEDYASAIEMYEALLQKFPESSEAEEALFHLSACYQKTGDIVRADSASALLKKGYPNSKFTALPTTGKVDAASQQYESIYRLFIEGRFEQARDAKLNADKQFGNSYWTPQLLYIEAISYVTQRQDSLAINRLQYIVSSFHNSPMAARAATMIDVLKRRSEIEDYLTNLNVERREEVLTRGVDLDSTTTLAIVAPKKKDTLAVIQAPKNVKALDIKADSKPKPLVEPEASFSFNPSDSQYVMIIMDKVDPVFVSEGRNAFNRFNQERFNILRINSSTLSLKSDLQLVLFGPFANASIAVTYLETTRPQASARIIPWLPADKYSFSIISPANLSLLKTNRDIAGYRTFMQKIIPDKF